MSDSPTEGTVRRVTRGDLLLHLHPDLLVTLRKQYQGTQAGGITFENYVAQLLETFAADLRLPNCKPVVEAPRSGRHVHNRGPSHNAEPRKKNFPREALEKVREVEKDPDRIAAMLARMGDE